MGQRDKLLQKMRATPSKIRFTQAEALLRYEGFVLFKARGIHRTYYHEDGRALTLVRPHGRRKTCHPDDIRKLLRVLGL